MTENAVLAAEIERLGEAYRLANGPTDGGYVQADDWCRAALPFLRACDQHLPAILAALRAPGPEPAADAVAVTDAMVEAALDAQQVYWKPPWRDDPFAPERKADMRKAISAALAAAQEGS